MKQKRLMSAVKPTGVPHIGNYFGALKQFVTLQNQFDSYFMVADYHALTSVDVQESPTSLTDHILDITATYLAIGLDAKKVCIFQQSQVPEHTELTWIFNCITTMPYLMRAHAYKDAIAKNREVSVGTFDYPLLMATDILLYDTDIVPVGHDQRQHIEYARDTAEKFNRLYGETFNLPEAHILDSTSTVLGIDGQKMSKSYKNTIPLFSSRAEIQDAVMRIVTDSRAKGEPLDPDTDVLFQLHLLFSQDSATALREKYLSGTIGYKESKELLVENIDLLTKPIRDNYHSIIKDRQYVLDVLKSGSKNARSIAAEKMHMIKKNIGVLL